MRVGAAPDRRHGEHGLVRDRTGLRDGGCQARRRVRLQLGLPRHDRGLARPSPTYQLRLPGPIPAKDFWSVVVYDVWTRSMLANGQPHPSLSTYSPGVQADDDGGVTLYIGPEPPPEKGRGSPATQEERGGQSRPSRRALRSRISRPESPASSSCTCPHRRCRCGCRGSSRRPREASTRGTPGCTCTSASRSDRRPR